MLEICDYKITAGTDEEKRKISGEKNVTLSKDSLFLLYKCYPCDGFDTKCKIYQQIIALRSRMNKKLEKTLENSRIQCEVGV